MTLRAPPAPLSLKKKQGNIGVIIHHQKHNGERTRERGGRRERQRGKKYEKV